MNDGPNFTDHWKSEFEAIRKQMEVNAAFSRRYEDALWKIAKMCGWESDDGCTGAPVDADTVAIAQVEAKLKL